MKKSILTTILLCVAAVTTAQDMPWFMHESGTTTISTPTHPMGIYSPSTLMTWTNYVTAPTTGALTSTL